MRNKFLKTRNVALAVLAALLALCLTFGIILLPDKVTASGDANASVWDGGLIKAGWADTETDKAEAPATYVLNTDANTLEIGSAEALAYFAHQVYVDTDHALDGVKVLLTCDIDLGGDNNIWVPIGTTKPSSDPAIRFSGEFDGQGHTISNLSSAGFINNIRYDSSYSEAEGCYIDGGNGIKIPFNTDNGRYAYGLFGVTADVTVKNLKISELSLNLIDFTLEERTFVADSVGAVIGYNEGSLLVENCVAGKLDDDGISDSGISITTANNVAIGGLVGRAYAGNGDINIKGGVNNVNIDYTPNYNADGQYGTVGGILGYGSDFGDLEISDCENRGNLNGGQYVGGILGNVNPSNGADNFTIDNCVNYGDITSANLDYTDFGHVYTYAGGIAAYIGVNTQNTTSVTNSGNYGTIMVYDTESAGYNVGGGIIGMLTPSENGETIITGNYNYGDIYGEFDNIPNEYTPRIGGYLGYQNYYEGGANSINLTISGGSIGRVNVSANSVGQSVNIHSLIGYNGNPDKTITSVNLIDAGSIDLTTPNGDTEDENVVTFSSGNVYQASATSVATNVLKYNDDHTVITGLEYSDTETAQDIEIEIPAGVTAIAEGAFANVEKLVNVTFAPNSAIKEIGGWAFAGTGITEVKIPAQVTKIGTAAFANCSALNYVELPVNAADISYGNNVFNKQEGTPAYLLANDSRHYEKLSSSDDVMSSFTGAVLTYRITIKYYSGTQLLGEEVRLCNTDYTVQLIDGKWVDTDIDRVGPDGHKDKNWYYDARLIDIEAASELLRHKESGGSSDDDEPELPDDTITLYTFEDSEITEKKFVARNNIFFDEDATYTTSELNVLLSETSRKIEPGMRVTITGFKAFGESESTEVEEIHNAGTYTITVEYGEKSEEFELTVQQQTVNLGDYNQLSWKVEGANGNTDLRDMLLYIYKDANGRDYPSNSVLTSEQLAELGISGGYTTKQVLYSVVRYSGENITVCVDGNPAYTVNGNSTHREIGTYQASATLTPDGNYKLVNSGSASSLRGMSIEFNADGTVTVTKTWYIVNITNWLVNASGAEYSIQNFIYGNNPNFSAPLLRYTNYDSSAELTFYFELQLNGATVGDIFTRDEIGNYINSTMPAGSYKLIVTVGAVTSAEWDEETDPNHTGEPALVYHAGFTESRTFTVERKSLQSLAAFDAVIKGMTFTYTWDGNSHFYEQSKDATDAYNAFLERFAKPVRTGVWDDPEYNGYYGSPVVSYNLDRMQSSDYYTSEFVNTREADTYKVYYKVSALNYYDTLERLSSGSRTDFYFTVINVKEIAVPAIYGKTFTGETLTADVTVPYDDNGNPLYYTVQTNNGGVKVGSYNVVFKLLDPEHYMWEGQSAENKTDTITVQFNINKSPDNYFTTTLGITTWVVGNYEKLDEFPVVAGSRFGEVILTLSYSDDIENVIYTGANGTEEFAKALSELKEGTYILTATVADSSDFNGISSVITFRVFEKDGLPWWAVLLIVAGALGIVALVFFILHQKGVLQMLTGRFIIAMRTKATVDATIAAVRANKVAAEAKKTVAKAEAIDRLQALREAQAKAKNMSAEEQAAALEEKAQAAAKSAERFQKRANNMQKRADRLKQNADSQDAQAQAEQTVASDEPTEPTQQSDGEN